MELFALLLQAILVVLKYYFDPARVAERRELERDQAIETVGRAIKENRLRLVSKLIDLELRKQSGDAAGNRSGPTDPYQE